MAKSHEGEVYYHPDRPIIHFGSPVGLTYAKPAATLDTSAGKEGVDTPSDPVVQ